MKFSHFFKTAAATLSLAWGLSTASLADTPLKLNVYQANEHSFYVSLF